MYAYNSSTFPRNVCFESYVCFFFYDAEWIFFFFLGNKISENGHGFHVGRIGISVRFFFASVVPPRDFKDVV